MCSVVCVVLQRFVCVFLLHCVISLVLTAIRLEEEDRVSYGQGLHPKKQRELKCL